MQVSRVVNWPPRWLPVNAIGTCNENPLSAELSVAKSFISCRLPRVKRSWSGTVINVGEVHVLDFLIRIATIHFRHVDHADIVGEGDVSILVVEAEMVNHRGIEIVRELATVVVEAHTRHGINEVAEGEVGCPISANEVGGDLNLGGAHRILTVSIRGDFFFLARTETKRDSDECDCKNVFLHTVLIFNF